MSEEQSSPICRGKNLTLETVFSFVNAMPLMPMPRNEFHAHAEARLEGWTQTHSQIARQLAFYYEKNGMCYPRFRKKVSGIELLKYMQNWATNYFIPNIYTPSLNGKMPTNIYAFLKEQIALGIRSFDIACHNIYGMDLNNTDKIRVYVSNFTDIVIDKNKMMSINENLNCFNSRDIHPVVNEAKDEESFFKYFNNGLEIVEKTMQKIFFGAPGTGKSNTIKRVTAGKSVIRTTFHPDSDYSTFVGSYKPTMEEREVRVVPVVTANGINLNENQGTYKEKKIVYKFVKQSFLKAYLSAWKKYSQNPDSAEEQYLVIEEINRGNCAQIFGDIFQLLDRSSNGFSSYPIEADDDIRQEIDKAFSSEEEFKIESELQVDFAVDDYTSNYGETLSKDIQKGRIMLLPPNLYLWATMNTSDQSLFPIDSAFKRRWEWIYIPINTKEQEWYINVDDTNYVWGSFLDEINKKIHYKTSSEDKQLGFYFCKADGDTISADRFVGKVLFYIYNDVFKDYGFDDEIFKKTDEEQFAFQDFYNNNGTVKEVAVKKFLDNLHVKIQGIEEEIDDDDEDDDHEEGGRERDRSRYTINGEGNYPKKELSTEAVRKYIELNPQKTAAEVISDWKALGNIVPHFVESQEEYDQRSDNSRRDNVIECNGQNIHVEHNGWQPITIQRLIDAVNEKEWGIILAKIE